MSAPELPSKAQAATAGLYGLWLADMGWAYLTIDQYGPDLPLLLWHAFVAFSVMPPAMRTRLRDSIPMVQRLWPIGQAPTDGQAEGAGPHDST